MLFLQRRSRRNAVSIVWAYLLRGHNKKKQINYLNLTISHQKPVLTYEMTLSNKKNQQYIHTHLEALNGNIPWRKQETPSIKDVYPKEKRYDEKRIWIDHNYGNRFSTPFFPIVHPNIVLLYNPWHAFYCLLPFIFDLPPYHIFFIVNPHHLIIACSYH